MKKVIMIRVGFWVKLFLGLLLLAMLVSLGRGFTDERAVAVLADGTFDAPKKEVFWLTQKIQQKDVSTWQTVLIKGWRLLEKPIKHQNVLAIFLGYDPVNPYEQIGQGMSVWQTLETSFLPVQSELINIEHEDIYLDNEAVVDDWHFELSDLSDISLSEDVAILLYHTHNAETYKPTDGASKREGENGGVATAAEMLKNALEQKYGLKTFHSKVLHDYPNWNRSYINSLATVKDLLASNPKVQAVFDVHRDAGFTSKEPTTTEINGKKAAKIMIVVGANHENWQSNLTFAQALEDKSNELYPGLVRSIRIVQANRYNQQAHPHSLILEIGSDLNTQEEANYAMECFAQVIAEVLLAPQS